jgi:hypothetical protein
MTPPRLKATLAGFKTRWRCLARLSLIGELNQLHDIECLLWERLRNRHPSRLPYKRPHRYAEWGKLIFDHYATYAQSVLERASRPTHPRRWAPGGSQVLTSASPVPKIATLVLAKSRRQQTVFNRIVKRNA